MEESKVPRGMRGRDDLIVADSVSQGREEGLWCMYRGRETL